MDFRRTFAVLLIGLGSEVVIFLYQDAQQLPFKSGFTERYLRFSVACIIALIYLFVLRIVLRDILIPFLELI